MRRQGTGRKDGEGRRKEGEGRGRKGREQEEGRARNEGNQYVTYEVRGGFPVGPSGPTSRVHHFHRIRIWHATPTMDRRILHDARRTRRRTWRRPFPKGAPTAPPPWAT